MSSPRRVSRTDHHHALSLTEALVGSSGLYSARTQNRSCLRWYDIGACRWHHQLYSWPKSDGVAVGSFGSLPGPFPLFYTTPGTMRIGLHSVASSGGCGTGMYCIPSRPGRLPSEHALTWRWTYQGAAAYAMTSKSGTESKPGGGQVTDPAPDGGAAAAAASALAKRTRERAATITNTRSVGRYVFITFFPVSEISGTLAADSLEGSASTYSHTFIATHSRIKVRSRRLRILIENAVRTRRSE